MGEGGNALLHQVEGLVAFRYATPVAGRSQWTFATEGEEQRERRGVFPVIGTTRRWHPATFGALMANCEESRPACAKAQVGDLGSTSLK